MQLDLRTTRITEAEHLRDFIECFSCRVINRPAQDAVFIESADLDKQGVSAADDQGNIRLDLEIAGEKWRKQMAFEMVDGEIRFGETERETLGDGSTDHER